MGMEGVGELVLLDSPILLRLGYDFHLRHLLRNLPAPAVGFEDPVLAISPQ